MHSLFFVLYCIFLFFFKFAIDLMNGTFHSESFGSCSITSGLLFFCLFYICCFCRSDNPLLLFQSMTSRNMNYLQIVFMISMTSATNELFAMSESIPSFKWRLFNFSCSYSLWTIVFLTFSFGQYIIF